MENPYLDLESRIIYSEQDRIFLGIESQIVMGMINHVGNRT